jgi:hypothetical protein
VHGGHEALDVEAALSRQPAIPDGAAGRRGGDALAVVHLRGDHGAGRELADGVHADAEVHHVQRSRPRPPLRASVQ